MHTKRISVISKLLLLLLLTSSSHLPAAAVLWPFVRDYLGEPIPEETFTHSHAYWSSMIHYLLPPSIGIYGILSVQFTCLIVFLHNFCPSFHWSTSRSNMLHFIFYTFLHPITVFFLQHTAIPLQPILLWYQNYII